jgi:hypothetical protein
MLKVIIKCSILKEDASNNTKNEEIQVVDIAK